MEEKRTRGYRVKTINAVLTKKFNEFAASITDDAVRDLVQANTVITGGCIASMLMGEEVKDFDLYFTNKKTVLAVANYYVNQFRDAHPTMPNKPYVLDGADMKAISFKLQGTEYTTAGGVGLNMTVDRVKIVIKSSGNASDAPDDDKQEDYVEPVAEVKPKEEAKTPKPKYRPVYLTCNAITLSDGIQLVIRFYGSPAEIHDTYDYVHCTNYWTSMDKQVVLNIPAMQATMAKELVYMGSKYPIASLIRTRKFIGRGWVINAGQYLKMAFQVSRLDLSDISTLEDQLVGVDVAYFNQLIDAMQEDSAKAIQAGKPVLIDYGYLVELIDKLF